MSMTRDKRSLHAQKKQDMQLPTAAAFTSICIALYVIPHCFPIPESMQQMSVASRLEWSLKLSLIPTATLIVLILRQAFFRMSSADDIDAALKKPTQRATVQQSQIQNTLEQLVIAVPVYTCAAVQFESSRLLAIPMAAGLFLCGRIAFVLGYDKSSPGRAFGFSITLMPTILLLVEVVVMILLE
jgi:hypothetical protein